MQDPSLPSAGLDVVRIDFDQGKGHDAVTTPQTDSQTVDGDDNDSTESPIHLNNKPKKRVSIVSPKMHRRFQTMTTYAEADLPEEEVTGISRLEVRKPELFLNYLDRLGEVLRTAPGFLGRDVIEPQPGSSISVVIMRFKDVRNLNAWKNSEARRAIIKEGEEKNVFRVVALDVEEGSSLAVIDPSKFEESVKFSSSPAPVRTEPAKWKVAVTIYFAVIALSLPINLYLRPILLASGFNPRESYFTCASLITIGIVYLTSPLISLIAKPFLRPWPTTLFDGIVKYEPFKSLELGLPCLRPEPPAYLAVVNSLRAEITSLENLIDEIEHKSHLQRWRLQGRVERLEESMVLLQDAVEPFSDPVEGRSRSLSDIASHRQSSSLGAQVVPPPPTGAGDDQPDDVEAGGNDKANKEPDSGDKLWSMAELERSRLGPSHESVTVVIHERVKPGMMADFVDHVHKLATLAKRFRGFAGCSLVKPRKGGDQATVIIKYASYALLHDFLASEQRRRWLVKMKELVQEEASCVELQTTGPRDVVDHIFRNPMASTTGANAGTGLPVQKWKMAVLIFIALGSVGYALFAYWVFPTYLPTLGLIRCLLFGTCISVSITIFITIPLLLLLLRRWVFAPWSESPYPLIKVLQKGFPCLS